MKRFHLQVGLVEPDPGGRDFMVLHVAYSYGGPDDFMGGVGCGAIMVHFGANLPFKTEEEAYEALYKMLHALNFGQSWQQN